MKKLSIFFISLLSLCACNTQNNDKNTSVVQEKKYAYVNIYDNVSYHFDKYMRCVVHYEHFKGSDDSGYVLDYTKDWCVYLKDFYVVSDYGWNSFYECKTKTNLVDYYLVVY